MSQRPHLWPKRHPQARSPRRRGAVLVAMLVCLLVVAVLGGALLRSLVIQQRQLRVEQRQLQAFWLAQSAAERARAQLHRSADYTGETWQVETGEQSGRAVILVETLEDRPGGRRVTIEAAYGDDEVQRVQARKALWMTLPAAGET